MQRTPRIWPKIWIVLNKIAIPDWLCICLHATAWAKLPLTTTIVSFALFLIFGRLAIGIGFKEWQQYLYCEKTWIVIKKIWTKLQTWYDCVSATMQQLGPNCLTVSFALFSTLGRFWTHFYKTDWLCIGHHATARAELPDYYYCEFCPLLNFWQTGDWHPYSLVANFRIGF